MNMSVRTFLLDNDDRIFRLPARQWERILADPEAHPVPRFSGQQVRSAEVVVQLQNRKPVAVVRSVYQLLEFNSAGVLDTEILRRRAAVAFDDVIAGHGENNSNLISADNDFLVRGGRWKPKLVLERAIYEAALGKVRAARP